MLRRNKNKWTRVLEAPSAIGLLSMVLLSGCAGDDIPMLTIDSVSFYADLDANQNSAIPIDLVLVYSTEVNKMISSLSASKYYQNSVQLQRDNPTALDVWHWELVPGQSVEDFEISQSKGDAFDGYIFANYLSPGDHRIKVPPSGKVKILLLKNDMKDLATLNVQNVTQGISAPSPQHIPTATSEATQSDKTQQVSRSTSDFKAFDTRPKGDEPELTPPYLFQVPSEVNTGQTGPIDLRPDDSKKGQGDTNLIFPPDPSAPDPRPCPAGTVPKSSLSDTSTTTSSTPCNTSTSGTIYDTMPSHGPETTTHTHSHPHEVPNTESGCPTATKQVTHSHEHGHPHPLIGGTGDTISTTTKLAPPEGASH